MSARTFPPTIEWQCNFLNGGALGLGYAPIDAAAVVELFQQTQVRTVSSMNPQRDLAGVQRALKPTFIRWALRGLKYSTHSKVQTWYLAADAKEEPVLGSADR